MRDPFDETPLDGSASNGSAKGQDRLAQLQEMIDEAAHVAAPILKEIAAKAAELAAVAAEQAGPLAQKAAERTQVVGEKVAARSKEVAADLRRDVAAAEASPAEASTEKPAEPFFTPPSETPEAPEA